MATSVKRVCWDACAWIAVIRQERLPNEDRNAMGREVLAAADRGQVEIVTSALNLSEVCKTKCSPQNTQDNRGVGERRLAEYFEREDVLMLNVDRFVGVTARRLMLQQLPGLRPADAVHVATALVADAVELHTFDDKLLKLNGRIQRDNGKPLVICKPHIEKAAAPLLDKVEGKPVESEGEDDTPGGGEVVRLADRAPRDRE